MEGFHVGEVWLVVESEPGSPVSHGDVVVLELASGERLVPLFTDSDLASRFRDGYGDECGAVRLTTAAALLSFLESLEERGIARVTLDPGPDSGGFALSIAGLKADVGRSRTR